MLRRGSGICGQLMGGHAAVESGWLGFGLGRVGHPLNLCHFDFVLLVGLVDLVVAGTHAPVHVIIEVLWQDNRIRSGQSSESRRVSALVGLMQAKIAIINDMKAKNTPTTMGALSN